MTSHAQDSEATVRLKPEGARGSAWRRFLGLLEEEIRTGAERDQRHSEQHVCNRVGLAHRLDVARTAVRRAAFELVLLVVPVERIDAPSAERRQAHTTEHVRQRIATAACPRWLRNAVRLERLRLRQRHENGYDAPEFLARGQGRGERLAASVEQRELEAMRPGVELQRASIELGDRALAVEQRARPFDGSTVTILGNEHDTRRHRHHRFTERDTLAATHRRADFRSARNEALFGREQATRIAFDLARRMRLDAGVSRPGRTHLRRHERSTCQQQQGKPRSSNGHQKHASLKRLTPFLSKKYGTVQSLAGFAFTEAGAALAAGLRGLWPATEGTLCPAGAALPGTSASGASGNGSRAAAVTSKGGAGRAACAATTGADALGARRVRPQSTKKPTATATLTGTSQPFLRRALRCSVAASSAFGEAARSSIPLSTVTRVASFRASATASGSSRVKSSKSRPSTSNTSSERSSSSSPTSASTQLASSSMLQGATARSSASAMARALWKRSAVVRASAFNTTWSSAGGNSGTSRLGNSISP